MATVTTQTEELGNSRVRVAVEVDPTSLEREVKEAARNIGRDLKLPGFRKGKIPPEVVIQRVGREGVLDDAVRRALPRWYEQAVADAGIVTVGEPSIDLSGLPAKGEPLAFSIEIAVRPEATLGDYRGIEVPRREAQLDPDAVDAEIAGLRESLASLEAVEREAQTGDFLELDFVGRVDGEPFEGGEARGYLLELGSGRLIPGFEEQLVGASAGEERAVEVTFPDEYAEHLAGKAATFDVTVKTVKEKRLPELDDDFASDAAGFDSLDELRADVESRLRAEDEKRIEGEFREAVVDAVAERATIDVPDEIVEAKARELWERTAHQIRHQGIDPAQYLQLTGKTEEELVAEARPDAERALRREAVLAAVVEAEDMTATDDELIESLRAAAGGEPEEAKLRKALEQLRDSGRDELLREDVAMRKAVDLLTEAATPIPAETAAARDKLWTPEKESDEGQRAGAGDLWTPGS